MEIYERTEKKREIKKNFQQIVWQLPAISNSMIIIILVTHKEVNNRIVAKTTKKNLI